MINIPDVLHRLSDQMDADTVVKTEHTSAGAGSTLTVRPVVPVRADLAASGDVPRPLPVLSRDSTPDRNAAPAKPPESARSCEPEGRLMTVAQLAERLNVPRTWVYSRTARNAIPLRRLGQYVRFDWIEVQGWMNTGCPDPYKMTSPATAVRTGASAQLASKGR